MVASYNGWRASPNRSDIGVVDFTVTLDGVDIAFPSGVKAGAVATCFTYLVQQFHARVERVINPGCWGYYFKTSANSASLISCHSSGTAIDIDAPRHPNGQAASRSFSPAQIAQIRAILAELSGVIYWGGDAWNGGTPDSMHFEIAEGVTEGQVAAAAAKITAPPAQPWLNLADVRATPRKFQAWYNAFPFNPPLLPVIKPLADNFGPQSVAALEKIQARYGLVADGIVGPLTKKLLWDLGWKG